MLLYGLIACCDSHCYWRRDRSKLRSCRSRKVREIPATLTRTTKSRYTSRRQKNAPRSLPTFDRLESLTVQRTFMQLIVQCNQCLDRDWYDWTVGGLRHVNTLTGFPRLLESSGFLFSRKFRTLKVLEKHFGPEKSWKLKLKVLEKISLKVKNFSSGSNQKYRDHM